MQQLWDDIAAMLQAPFVGSLDLEHLFLLVGFVMVAAAIWALIMHILLNANVELEV